MYLNCLKKKYKRKNQNHLKGEILRVRKKLKREEMMMRKFHHSQQISRNTVTNKERKRR